MAKSEGRRHRRERPLYVPQPQLLLSDSESSPTGCAFRTQRPSLLPSLPPRKVRTPCASLPLPRSASAPVQRLPVLCCLRPDQLVPFVEAWVCQERGAVLRAASARAAARALAAAALPATPLLSRRAIARELIRGARCCRSLHGGGVRVQ